MKYAEIINESMSFHPYVQKGKSFEMVFPSIWRREILNDPFSPTFQTEPDIPNPDYKPEFDLNLTNRNMQIVWDALGLNTEELIDITTFINIARSWLRNNINKPSKGFDSQTNHKSDEELFYEASDEVHSLDMTLLKKQIEKEIRQKFPLRPDKDIAKSVDFRLRIVLRNMVEELFKKKIENRGLITFDGGLADGYVNKNVLKMVQIAEKGREMGATHVGLA